MFRPLVNTGAGTPFCIGPGENAGARHERRDESAANAKAVTCLSVKERQRFLGCGCLRVGGFASEP
jgi:hypothetical protein